MATSLRTFDEGAWISVDDSREVGVSDVWTLTDGEFCSCDTAHVLLEAFSETWIDGADVVASGVGMCIDCGTRDGIGRLPVGRLVDGEFKRYEPGAVHSTL